MSTPVIEQNRAYRRGLVLGLTMAEIAVLIIFCLLIASAFLMQEKEHRIEGLIVQNNDLVQVKGILERLRTHAVDPAKFDDLFKELKRIQAQVAKAEQMQAQLDKLIEENKQFSKDAEYVRTIKDSLKGTIFQDKAPEALSDALKASGDLGKATADKREAEIEAERLKGQLAYAQQKLERLGKGTEMPACWADPKTGKVEYIFRIDLTSTGLIIHDQHLPNRVEEQALLPLNSIVFDREVNQEQFSSQTKPLAQWSKNHGCRFFVIARDQTEAEEKDIYKSMLRTLEDHFYKYVTQ